MELVSRQDMAMEFIGIEMPEYILIYIHIKKGMIMKSLVMQMVMG